MRTALMIALGCFLFGSVAQAREIKGTGNFRRKEALRAAGAGSSAFVTGLGAVKKEYQARFHMVVNKSRVTLVEAPLDRTHPVRTLDNASAKARGLITQEMAQEYASSNGKRGAYGPPGAIEVKPVGKAYWGKSYSFYQVGSGKKVDTYVGPRWDWMERTVSPYATSKGKGAESAVLRRDTALPVAP